MEYKVIEDEYGNIKWYYGKVLHKENGPAVERHDGTKEWWINGELHREDGPAIEFADGTSKWFLDGKNLSKEDFDKIIEVKNTPPIEEPEERFEYTIEEVKSWLSDFSSVVISSKTGDVRWANPEAKLSLWSILQALEDDENGLHAFANNIENIEKEDKKPISPLSILSVLLILAGIAYIIYNHLPY